MYEIAGPTSDHDFDCSDLRRFQETSAAFEENTRQKIPAPLCDTLQRFGEPGVKVWWTRMASLQMWRATHADSLEARPMP
jgi:hypothetical protein